VRATRAYMAGFGTAGSLLAGAAIMFVFASAVVSFRGWPQASQPSQPFAVVLAQTAGSAQAKHVGAVAAAEFPAVGAGRGAAGRGAGAAPAILRTSRQRFGRVVGRTPDVRVIPPRIGTVTVASGGTASAPSCTTGVCVVHRVGSTLGSTATSATSAVGSTVSRTGDAAGSALTRVTGTVGSKVGAVSPPLGHLITKTGTAVGGTVTGATTLLGSTVSSTGKTVGGLISGKPFR
jgi:hypothetical protein